MVEPASPVPPPAVLQGRYQVGPLIGQGGASRVYRAVDLLLGRDVAVKIFLTLAIKTEDLRTQEGEARLLGGLNHPGLVTLLDAGVHLSDASAPQVFLVMEYVEGSDLRQRLRQGAISALELAYLGWDLLTGLQHVHEHGIIHRDLKPANVLLAETTGRPPRGKLADFGIAVLREQFTELTGETTGTAAYLSPEQVDGLPIGPATDIYSLGLVLIEAFTAKVAFPGGVLESALARLDRAPDIPDEMPKALADTLRAMTARDPAERPTAAEAVEVFRKIIADEVGEKPRTPDPEAERVAAVRDYGLIGTPPDEEFDRITALAARLFDVPVAVISIVDSDRVWFKSRQGLDITEAARTRGLGATGGLHDQTLVIEDAAEDPRVAHVPGAEESPYRFYAGVPLVTRDGFNLGTLAIADTRPRSMSALDLATLEDLAAMALHQIEIRRAARRVVRDSIHIEG